MIKKSIHGKQQILGYYDTFDHGLAYILSLNASGLAVTEAIAERKNCAFMVSTHIIEVGQELGKRCDNVTFEYLPTVMKGKLPTYTYKLEPGITSDKHGMIIINNEKIIEIIKGEVAS